MLTYDIVAAFKWVSIDNDDMRSSLAVVGKVTAPDAMTALAVARQRFPATFTCYDGLYSSQGWTEVAVHEQGKFSPSHDERYTKFTVWETETGTGAVLLGTVWGQSEDNAKWNAQRVWSRKENGHLYGRLTVVRES